MAEKSTERRANNIPYIQPSNRTALDPAIEALAKSLHTNSKDNLEDLELSGNLNYAITKLVTRLIVLRYNKVRYEAIARFTGVLKNVSDEFYRRVAAPYEDKKKSLNGDVYAEVL
jgi:hypothetical protein